MEINEQANTLFLGDLSIHCTERDVRKLFRSFGAIETIRIKRNSNARTNLCYGFVKFSSKEGAEAAMTQLNGSMFLGRCIRYSIEVFVILLLVSFHISQHSGLVGQLRKNVNRRLHLMDTSIRLLLNKKLHRSMSVLSPNKLML